MVCKERTATAVIRQFSMKILFILLLICSFLFPQEPCEGTCLSEQESVDLVNKIKRIEFDLEKSLQVNENLNGQIKLYMEQHANDSLLIDLNMKKSQLLNSQVKLYNDLVKEVKPKWYENKWLWFTLGVITTTGTLKIASDLVD